MFFLRRVGNVGMIGSQLPRLLDAGEVVVAGAGGPRGVAGEVVQTQARNLRQTMLIRRSWGRNLIDSV